MSNIQVYATKVDVEADGTDTVSVWIEGVDASDFVNEFTVDEILSVMDYDKVHDWVILNRSEEE